MVYVNSILLFIGITLSVYHGYKLEFGEPTNKTWNYIYLGVGLGMTLTEIIIIGILSV